MSNSIVDGVDLGLATTEEPTSPDLLRTPRKHGHMADGFNVRLCGPMGKSAVEVVVAR